MGVASDVGAGSTKPRERFGNYLVFERLGTGGMATVHRAIRQGIEGFEQVVALKRMLPHLAEDSGFVASFIREAKLASMLQHQRIIQIYDLGRVDDTYFIAMEYIEGSDLRELLRCAHRLGAPPPLDVTLSILNELCEGLDYAHTRVDKSGDPLGLVHRDVSPSNLLIAEAGNLKVIDFGIAKAGSAELRTDSGRVRGKCPYMSPEAVQGRVLDARSDIFSTGVIAHELLTARPLFASQNEYETLTKVQYAEAFPPSIGNPACPLEIDDVVLRALDKDPSRRWPTAAAMREALQEAALVHRIYPSNRRVATWLADARVRMAEMAGGAAAAPLGDAVVTKVTGERSGPHPQGSGRIARAPSSPPVEVVSGTGGRSAVDPVEEEVVRIVWGHGRGVASVDGDNGLPTADDLEIPLPPATGARLRRPSTPPVLGPELLADARLVDGPPPDDVVNITFRAPEKLAADEEPEDPDSARPTRKLALVAPPTPPPRLAPVSEPPPPPAAVQSTTGEMARAAVEDTSAVPRRRMPRALSVPVVIGSLDLKPPGADPTYPRASTDSGAPAPAPTPPAQVNPVVIALVAVIVMVIAAIVYVLAR